MLERLGAPFRGFGDWLAGAVDGFYRILGRPGKWLQDVINGSWLGHPVHPVVTDVVLGGAALIAVFDLATLLADGAVRHGPASVRQVAYRARIENGQIEVQGPID